LKFRVHLKEAHVTSATSALSLCFPVVSQRLGGREKKLSFAGFSTAQVTETWLAENGFFRFFSRPATQR
jgi:hypothetical protein